MMVDDLPTIEHWSEPWNVPENTLRVALETFGDHGYFFVGEYEGKPVACHVVLPWSEKVCSGGFLYVESSFRHTTPFASRIIQECHKMAMSNGSIIVGDSVLTKTEYEGKIGRKLNPAFHVTFNSFLFNLLVKTSLQLESCNKIDWTICLVNKTGL